MFKLILYCAGAYFVYKNDSTLRKTVDGTTIQNKQFVASIESFVINVRTYAKANTSVPFPTQFLQTLSGLFSLSYRNWTNEIESLNSYYKQMIGTDVVRETINGFLAKADFNSDSSLQQDGLNVSYLNTDPNSWS